MRSLGREVLGKWGFQQEGGSSHPSYGWDQDKNGSVDFSQGKVVTVIDHFPGAGGGSSGENCFPRSLVTPRGLRSSPRPPKMGEACLVPGNLSVPRCEAQIIHIPRNRASRAEQEQTQELTFLQDRTLWWGILFFLEQQCPGRANAQRKGKRANSEDCEVTLKNMQNVGEMEEGRSMLGRAPSQCKGKEAGTCSTYSVNQC